MIFRKQLISVRINKMIVGWAVGREEGETEMCFAILLWKEGTINNVSLNHT